jgi:N-acetyl-gamma-glutamyl-phosphate reductase
MMNKDVARTVGIYGASGYAGREALSIVGRHPGLRLGFASSEREAGTALPCPPRAGSATSFIRAEEADAGSCAVVLSCLPHGESAGWVRRASAAGARVVDLSADLRVAPAAPEWWSGAVYGLPELHREQVRDAALVANPGCYPTGVLLALAPLLRRGLVRGPVMVSAASGVTGAGRSARPELLFGEVAEDFRAYAPRNTHRHLAEMRAQARELGGTGEIVFNPHLLPVRRGILESIHVTLAAELDDPQSPWREDYAGEPLVELRGERTPSLHDVVGSDRVAIAVHRVEGVDAPMLLLVVAFDNLRKGAAGQAVQNVNLMLGLPETEGLAA